MLLKNLFLQCFGLLLIIGTILHCKAKPEGQRPASKTAGKGQVAEALPSSIWSIYQDSENHYWFGSNGQGVFYYDGDRIINYTTADGLADDQIRGMQADRSGNIYFDTPGGITKFDGSNFMTLRSLPFVQNIWQSRPDDLWFEGDGNQNGVYRYDGEALYYLPLPEQNLQKAFGIKAEELRFSPYGVYGIYRDRFNKMWFGTLMAGVFRFDGSSFLWIGEKELSELEDGRVPGVRAMIEDWNGHFWLSNILSRYEITAGENGEVQYQKLPGIESASIKGQIDLPYFQSAKVDQSNKILWMCSFDEGVWRYDGTELQQFIVKDGDKKAELICLYQDRQGTIWLGTHNAGVYKLVDEAFQKFTPN